MPSNYVLRVVALAAAGAAAVNALPLGAACGAARGGRRAVVVLLVASPLIGSAWPGLVYHFREAPSAAKVDLGEIAHNQKATLAAFGLDGDITHEDLRRDADGDRSGGVDAAGRARPRRRR